MYTHTEAENEQLRQYVNLPLRSPHTKPSPPQELIASAGPPKPSHHQTAKPAPRRYV